MHHRWHISLSALFLLLLSACNPALDDFDCTGRDTFPTTSLIDESTSRAIADRVCDCLNRETVPGIQVTVIDSLGEIWTLSTGSADRKRTTPIEDDQQLRLASITKTFTAALTYRLQEEGLLSLQDPIGNWFPEYEEGQRITVAQLLDHSSGIMDLLVLPDLLLTSTMNSNKVWEPTAIAEAIFEKDLQFDPGTDHRYSNTNYLLLGLIAEEVTGQNLGQSIRQYLTDPLGLQNLSFQPVDEVPANLISGYDRDLIPEPGWYELSPENTAFSSAAYAAGNLTSNSEETARFYHALFTGNVLQSASLTDMMNYSVDADAEKDVLRDFGKGLFRYIFPTGTYYGHEGSYIGFDHIAIHQPESRQTVVLLANVSSYPKLDLLNEILALL